MKSKAARIILADENRLFIDSLKLVIESRKAGIKVVNTAQSCSEAIRKTEKEQPDIIVLDTNLPGMDGIELIKSIRSKAPCTKIIILTTNTEPYYIEESLKNEVSGYILKDIALTELITLLPLVNTKTLVLSRELIPVFFNRNPNYQNMSKNTYFHSPKSVFLDHEKKLFGFIMQGFSNREIAEKMHLAEQTVKNYVSHIYAKLGVRNRLQAIQKGKETISLSKSQ